MQDYEVICFNCGAKMVPRLSVGGFVCPNCDTTVEAESAPVLGIKRQSNDTQSNTAEDAELTAVQELARANATKKVVDDVVARVKELKAAGVSGVGDPCYTRVLELLNTTTDSLENDLDE